MTRPAHRRARRRAQALALVVLAGSGAAALHVPGAGGQEVGSGSGIVTVSPAPGVVTASPHTQISFRGRTVDQLQGAGIRVTGSRTGRHRGSLRGHSDAQGASFVVNRPFRPGESVVVRTRVPIAGARNGDFRFRTGRHPGRVNIPDLVLETINPGKRRRFHSRRDLRPPLVTVNQAPRPGTWPGHVFVGAKPKLRGRAQAGPMIFDNGGHLLWFHPLKGREAYDFRVQTLDGKPVLTWWQGNHRQGMGSGDIVVMDDHYQIIRRIYAGNRYAERADLHEFLITPEGTALVVVYSQVRRDLRSVGGPRRGIAVDSVVQELDLATGLVLFEWHSVGNVGLKEAFTPVPESRRVPWDYVHVNSVGVDTDGNLLVSGRSTSTVYKIHRRTGRMLWRLGGKRSSFRLGPGAKFFWQHDARRRADGAITLFDNSAFPPVRKKSRAIALDLDMDTHRARLKSTRVHPRGLLTATQGNHSALPNGNAFVGWGSQRYASEYAGDGTLLWDSRLSLGFESYRAYRSPWIGRPDTPPALAVERRSGGRIALWASWNGATEVVTWEVLAGPSAEAIQPIGTFPKSDFETSAVVQNAGPFVAVRARDARGEVLGVSPTRRVRG